MAPLGVLTLACRHLVLRVGRCARFRSTLRGHGGVRHGHGGLRHGALAAVGSWRPSRGDPVRGHVEAVPGGLRPATPAGRGAGVLPSSSQASPWHPWVSRRGSAGLGVRGEDRPQAFGAAMRESVNEARHRPRRRPHRAARRGDGALIRAAGLAVLSVVFMALFVLYPLCPARPGQHAGAPLVPGIVVVAPEQAAVFRLRHSARLFRHRGVERAAGAAQGCLAVYSVSLEMAESMVRRTRCWGFGAAVGSSLAARFRHRITASRRARGDGCPVSTTMLLSGPPGPSATPWCS
ncbi:hypothetical protein QJS66_00515 [Kocuria rhizophila]|nr:hypothetical protein QJS66_00515 [Kocuria rhizophila]